MKAKLTFVKNEQKTSKAGKPYTTCSIKTEATGNEYLNGFGNKQTASWLEGDEVDIKIFEEEYNGKMYKKFKALTEIDFIQETLDKVVKSLKLAHEEIAKLKKTPVMGKAEAISQVSVRGNERDITVNDLDELFGK